MTEESITLAESHSSDSERDKVSGRIETRIVSADGSLADAWDRYVDGLSYGSIFLQYGWKRVFERAYGLTAPYLCARQDNEIHGILPLIFHSSMVFGKNLGSLPYFDAAGIHGETDEIRNALLSHAADLAGETGAEHIELRHDRESAFDLPCRTSKVTLDLDLPSNHEDLWNGLKAKVRNQVRKAEKEKLTWHVGGNENLDAFYEIYCINMRDLGSPCHSLKFFNEIMGAFPMEARISLVGLGGKTIAAGFTLTSGRTMTIPWASSLREYNKLCPSMLLYWNILRYACEKGYLCFNFGQSSPDDGTFRFKKQWGAMPRDLYWYFWLPEGKDLPEQSHDSPKYARMIRIWQKLPVSVTKFLGPRIIQNLS